MEYLNQLRQLLENARAEANKLIMDSNTTAEQINAKSQEIEDIKAKIAFLEKQEEAEKQKMQNQINEGKAHSAEEATEEEKEVQNRTYVKAFAKAIAKKQLTDEEYKALSSNKDSDGGYLIPKDVLTKINLLSRQYESLRTEVTVVPVTTKEGSRILEVDAESNGFTDIEELEDLPNLNSPQWSKVDYKIRDLGGLLPIPNNLLDDETGGLVEYLAEWFVKKAYATDNKMILTDDGAKGSQGIIGTALVDNAAKNVFKKEILTTPLSFANTKSIINKDFPTTISKNLKIYTNQNGLDLLDNMEDKNGRPYLTGDGTQDFPYKFKGRIVKIYDNSIMKNVTEAEKEYIPFIFGDLKNAMVLFDRKRMSVASSKEAGFKNNSTIMRGIVRQDTRVWDKKAAKVVLSPIL